MCFIKSILELSANDTNKSLKETTMSFFDRNKDSYIDNANQALRFLSKYRSSLLANSYKQEHGTKIFGGPFEGMEFLDEVSEGCYLPKLLGIYESEIHDYILSIVKKKPDVFINIGSAEGYYSVGLKRLLPETDVFAFDVDLNAQNKCKILSEKNSVKVSIEGEFTEDIMKEFKGKNIFLMCDIEGFEAELFNAENIKLFKDCDICMELHEYNGIHNVKTLPKLFEKFHDIEIIYQKGKNFSVPNIIHKFSHLDILLAAWEWRSYPTPWLLADKKSN